MGNKRIVIVDDDPTILDYCRLSLSTLAHIECETYTSPAEALSRLQRDSADLVLSDLQMPNVDGIDLLKQLCHGESYTPVVILTAFPEVETAVQCMKLGALDYLTKPINMEELRITVQRILENEANREELRFLQHQLERPFKSAVPMIGTSPAFSKVLTTIERIAKKNVEVLVTGETGTGKELVSRRLHGESLRRNKRFVPVNCGAIPESLIESELFGHEKGAFTGATAKKPGLFEYAEGGTIFLDEVGEIPLLMQAKLLRALQEKTIRRVGGRQEIPVDVRIVAATNRNLQEEVQAKRFREDLYYRLNVIPIQLPALRDRLSDIPILAEFFLKQCIQSLNLELEGATAEFFEVLKTYSWPGNVRELQNVIKRSATLAVGSKLTADELPENILTQVRSLPIADDQSGLGFLELRETQLESFDRQYLTSLLSKHQGDVKRAALESQVPQASFYRWLKRYDIRAKSFKSSS
ncbi:MAG: sigma-54 dependent transcriptional regulator [Planctomycetota bacterium]|nr:sigma-54 dependent transcriptional regulator [Planctomycetota bacterium]